MSLHATTMSLQADRRSVSLVSPLVLVLGMALRIAAARGDLWIDEIWTLNLLAPIRTGDEVFWNISHDNNHFLNSLWMFLIGLDGPPILYRLPSIAMGALSIVVAARLGARTSPAAGVVTGLVFAIAFPFVNYGSEARGYAGLVLALLVAIEALDRALPLIDATEQKAEFDRQRWILGAAIGLGAFCHLTMLMGAAILGMIAVAEIMRTGRDRAWSSSIQGLVRLFLPSALLVVPVIVAVVAGILAHGRFTVGGLSYAPGRFLTGFSGMAGALLGLPVTVAPWIPVSIAGAGLVVAWLAKLIVGPRLTMTLIGIVLVPAVIALMNPPNTDYPRYFLVCGVMFAVIMSEAAGRAFARPIGAGLAFVCLLAFGAGQFMLNAQLIEVGRGNVSRIVAAMAAKPGATTYAAPFSTAFQLAMNYHAYRGDAAITRIALPLTCASKPDWYIFDAPPGSGDAPETLALGPDDCRMTFVRTLDIPTSAMSGRHWTLFERR